MSTIMNKFLLYFQDDFDSLRPLCYPNTNVFLLCFSVVSPTSFHNITEKWLPEIRHHSPKAPIILVGTQCDLRNDVKVLIELARYQECPVPESEARGLAEKIGSQYIECSALTQQNLKEVFDSAIIASLKLSKPVARKKSLKKLRKSKKYETSSLTRPDSSVIKKGWKKYCCLTWQAQHLDKCSAS